ncbi:MAG: glycosyltransferase family 4 protein [Candidatus Cloacimonetes bacterium]|nr:glycosyltransferase family 4 protein [Candidatus Cloacimonadota bacterium]
MKKLLHLQLLPLLSGVQNFSLHLLAGLNPEEYEIHVASQPGGPLVQEVQRRGYTYHPLSQLRHPISWRDIPAFWQILRLCKREGFDIVHTNSSKPGLLGRIAARLAGVPLIIHSSHGTPFQQGQFRALYLFYMGMEWVGGLFGDYIAFVNHSDRLNYIRWRLIPKRKAVTVYNALPDVEIEKLTAPPRSIDKDAEILIGSTLRFSTQKNIVEVILAACEACAQQPRLRFVFVGEGEHYALCRSIVSAKKMNERILLPGWDSNVSQWLAKMDVFLLYSRWEALPFSIIEANYSGLPVVGSAIESIMELVNDEVGWVVPLDDRQALVKTLVSLPQDPAQIREKAEKAARRIRELRNYKEMVEGYLELYRSVK